MSQSIVEGDFWVFVEHQRKRLFDFVLAEELSIDEVVATLLDYEVLALILHNSVAVL